MPLCSFLFFLGKCTSVAMGYYGGPVLANVRVYAVFWSSAVDATTIGGIGDFYRSLTDSQWMDWLTEYSTDVSSDAGSHAGQLGTEQTIGRGTFAGSYTLGALSKGYPTCPTTPTSTQSPPPPALTCVGDGDIQSELDWQIQHGNLPPPDANTVYMLHFPATVQVTSGQTASCQDFCAYHSTFQGTYTNGVLQNVVYGVIPDLGNNGCQNGCGNGSVFGNTCSAASHELGESITDSATGLIPGVDYPMGWYDSRFGEIGDMCQEGTDTLDALGFTGTGCDVTDAGCYVVQPLFSQVVWNSDPAQQPNVPACVSQRFAANDYSIAFSPNTVFLAGGQPATVPIVVALTSGSPQPLTLSITEVSPGLQASLDSTSLNVGDSAHLTVSQDATAALAQDSTVVVRATGATTHSAALLVQPNDWSLTLTPASGFVVPGTSQVYTVSGVVRRGNAEAIALASSVSGLPPEVSAAFSALTLTPGASTSLLTLSASPKARASVVSTFVVTGTSASQSAGHSVTADVQVDPPPTVAFTSPESKADVTGITRVEVVAKPGPLSSITSIAFAVDGQPLSTGLASSFSWDTRGLTTALHALQVTVLDANGGSASAQRVVYVTNPYSDFTLAATPETLRLPPDGMASFTVTNVAQGVSEPIHLALSGVPAGVDVASIPETVPAGSLVTVTLREVAGAARSEPSTITVLGTSPSQRSGHVVTVSVSVQPNSGWGCAASGAWAPSPWLLLATAAFARRRRDGAARERARD